MTTAIEEIYVQHTAQTALAEEILTAQGPCDKIDPIMGVACELKNYHQKHIWTDPDGSIRLEWKD